MRDFILLYKGLASDMSDMSEEQQKAVLDKWNVWMIEVGKSLKDIGAPMAPGISLVDNGNTGKSIDISGYSIISAKNLEDARSLCKLHPFLSEGKGNFSIEIYELTPIPMDI